MCKVWVITRKLNPTFPNALPEEVRLHLGAFESEVAARKVARRYCRRQYLHQSPYIGTPALFIWRDKNPMGAKHPWVAELAERPVKSTGTRVVPIRRKKRARVAPLAAEAALA